MFDASPPALPRSASDPVGVAAAHPRVLLAGARAAWIGPALSLAMHRGAVATVAVGLDAPFALERPGRATRRTRLALVSPNEPHRVIASGPMAFVYLDALDDDVRRIDLARPELTARRVVRALAPGTDEAPDDAASRLDALREALGVAPRAPSSAAVARVLRALDEWPDDFPTLAPAAALAGLSPSRFRHAFRDATGVPFRRYRLWRRMAAVARALGAGSDLTAAAAEAGFSSPSHLSAAFRRMFGLSPSALLSAGTRFEIGAEGDPEAPAPLP